MFSKVIFKVACFLLCLFASLQAADLHLIILGDTDSEDIKAAIQVDMRAVYFEAQRIASYTGMNLKASLFSGNDARTSTFFDVIRLLPTKREDAVIFYYTGHGYRVKDKGSQWPFLLFSRENLGVDLDHVKHIFSQKAAHLVLLIADCCNNVIRDKSTQLFFEKGSKSSSSLSRIKRNYRTLFLESSLMITVSSAGIGQTSLCNQQSGSYYTNSWLKALHNEAEVSNRSSCWNNIMERSAFIAREAALKRDHHQDAIYEVVPH